MKEEVEHAGLGSARLQRAGFRILRKRTFTSNPRDYETRIWYSDVFGDDCFVAQVVEWPGIMAHGDTREEAAREIQLALEGALEVAAEEGVQPPAPALAHA